VEVLKQWFDETLFDGLETMGIDMIEQNLIDLIRKINQNLLLMSRRMEETKSMGSTLTLLFVEEHEFFVLNVGDSRTYWFDRDRKFVTTDHTLAELELRAGHLTKEQAKKDPRRHILIQCKKNFTHSAFSKYFSDLITLVINLSYFLFGTLTITQDRLSNSPLLFTF
jgi:protein phosphatase